MSEYIISVDIGTQGTKAALFNTDINMLCTAFEPSRLISPRPGTVWQEADDLYLSCAHTINTLINKSGIDPKQIVAIGLDGQMAGIMGIDKNGEATTYYDSWLDTRSSSFVDVIKERAGKQIVSSSGGPVTCNHSSKILWWKSEYPEIYNRTAKFVLPHGYVAGKMTGKKAEEAVFDYTCLHFNSFSDNKNKCWSKEILQTFGIDYDKMPIIASPLDVVGYTTKDFAEMSGLVPGIPIVAGLGDSAASTFGSGMFDQDMLQDCAGTASIMCCVVDSYNPDIENETLTMMRSPIDGLWLPLAYINGGGMCIRWFRDNLMSNYPCTHNELDAEAKDIPAGSEGLLFCPHFSGRVLPSDPTLKGGYLGMDFKHTRGHLYRAIMEGIAYEYKYYLSIIRKNYPDSHFDDMITVGGGSNSALFNQIKADILGVNVHTFEIGETALIGSAVIAATGVGIISDYKKPIKRVMKEKNTYTTNAANHSIYEKCAASYIEMLNAVSSFFKNI